MIAFGIVLLAAAPLRVALVVQEPAAGEAALGSDLSALYAEEVRALGCCSVRAGAELEALLGGELRKLRACAGVPACITRVAAGQPLEQVATLRVRRDGRSLTLEMSRIDVKLGREAARFRGAAPADPGSAEGLREMLRKGVRELFAALHPADAEPEMELSPLDLPPLAPMAEADAPLAPPIATPEAEAELALAPIAPIAPGAPITRTIEADAPVPPPAAFLAAPPPPEPGPVAPPLATTAGAPPSIPGPPAAWIALGTGALAAATGAIFGAVTLQSAGDAGKAHDRAAWRESVSTARTTSNIATGAWVAAGLAGAAGVVLFVVPF